MIDGSTGTHYQIRRRLAVVLVGLLTAVGTGLYLWLQLGPQVALGTSLGLALGFVLGVVFSALWRFEE